MPLELMRELSRECAVTSCRFFLRGCCGLNAGVFACRSILGWYKELLMHLFLNDVSASIKIYCGYKIIVVTGTVSCPK